jgi:uncharacterized Zn finger protein
MPDLPSLSVADIRNWTNDRYYERGENYFHEDRIRQPRRKGRTLNAFCQGSQPSPYRIEIELDDDGIAAGTCSCPVGDGGTCKHAVALLLTWVQEPGAFTVVEPLPNRLATLSKEQLITLIRQMVDREPTLESVVDLAVNPPAANRGIDVRTYVEDAFDGVPLDPYENGYARAVADALDPLLERGREQIDAGHSDPAARLLGTVSEAVRAHLDTVNDDEGALLSVLTTCSDELGRLLATMPDDADREAVITPLIELFLWNVEAGGIGVGRSAERTLHTHTTPAERARAADRLREHLPDAPEEDVSRNAGSPASDFRSDWVRKSIGGLLLDLERDHLDAEAYVDLCRRTGHWAECAERLLSLDRTTDAVDAARHVPNHQLEPILDRLVADGDADRARALVRDRLDAPDPSAPLQRWLYEHSREIGDHETALTVARQMFRERPSPPAYDRAKTAAQALDSWSDVRSDLFAFLNETQRPRLHVRLHLHDRDLEAALDLVEPFAETEHTTSFGVPLLTEVADAVRETHPDAAIALYEECARRRIADRGRSNYRAAADLLTNAKRLYAENGNLDAWESFLDVLYEDELRRLPAARDEFEKAGLI